MQKDSTLNHKHAFFTNVATEFVKKIIRTNRSDAEPASLFWIELHYIDGHTSQSAQFLRKTNRVFLEFPLSTRNIVANKAGSRKI
jgi:hypothetical protein